MRSLFVVVLLILSAVAKAQTKPHVAKSAALAQRPYMGWSSWSFLRGSPTEEKVKAQVDVALRIIWRNPLRAIWHTSPPRSDFV